jgi:DNA polymerase elongation subunit (family B)/predicted RNA-binding Zn-ribbon protein involved in translation (DUF1610 family)
MNKEPKIVLFDLETSPNLSYTWAKYQQDVIAFQQEWELLCFCYKELGKKKVHSVSQENLSEEQVVKALWEVLDGADVVIAHNGDRFDIKKANAKFLEHGLTPPSGYATVDTYKVAKRYFSFNSNRLNDISQLLELGEKVPTGGFELWLGCMRGESQSWKKMVEYCKQDVNLLEKVYLELRPWMTNHPNHNVFTGESHSCPICGSKHTQKRGFSITRVGKRQRYQCQECGGWSVGEIIRTEVVTR